MNYHFAPPDLSSLSSTLLPVTSLAIALPIAPIVLAVLSDTIGKYLFPTSITFPPAVPTTLPTAAPTTGASPIRTRSSLLRDAGWPRWGLPREP
ncbi:hypothetical protein [Photorhabdus akhurstii]|uniref:hypothetical protein n=1 Tax=Photorhabdus akhurstii TaxID=171438 RepID=UPI003703F052